jgi:hypothetical protein
VYSNHVSLVKNIEELNGPIKVTLERPQSKKRVLQYLIFLLSRILSKRMMSIKTFFARP